MAKATATCKCATCGKEFQKIKMCVNRREADSWEVWAANHFDECEECKEKRIKMENDEMSKDSSYATLKGSEKQIHWANDIRREIVRKTEELLDSYDSLMSKALESGKTTAEQIESNKKILQCVIDIERSIEDSRFWIDNRTNDCFGFVNVIGRQYRDKLDEMTKEKK